MNRPDTLDKPKAHRAYLEAEAAAHDAYSRVCEQHPTDSPADVYNRDAAWAVYNDADVDAWERYMRAGGVEPESVGLK